VQLPACVGILARASRPDSAMSIGVGRSIKGLETHLEGGSAAFFLGRLRLLRDSVGTPSPYALPDYDGKILIDSVPS
jgi:hypothetical protein